MGSAGQETWRIGVLFSRSGLTEVTETDHFRGAALAIEEINRAGGVVGKLIEPVAYDPGSKPAEFHRLAEKLLTEDGVSAIFGCSTSNCRKAILPTVERRNGLLWYPSLYEGFEYSPNVIYTGAAPNQNSIQLARYMLTHHGKSVYLVGSDYIYPRESNRIMREFVDREAGRIVAEIYVPMAAGIEELRRIVRDIKSKRPDVVFSTVVGRAAQEFYRLYREGGLDPAEIPIASLTMGESEIRVIGPEFCVGHITSAPYFASLNTPANRRFVDAFRSRFGADAPVSMYAEASYDQIHLFALALARAQTMDSERLASAALGLEFDAPQGRIRIDPDNNHTILRPRIGVVNMLGDFDVVWEAESRVKPDPYLVNLAYDDAWSD